MRVSTVIRNFTELIFCRENVDPNIITRLLDISPTESRAVGELIRDGARSGQTSHLGLWKANLPNLSPQLSIEDQLSKWVEFLEPKVAAFERLRELDYHGYIDCKPASASLSLCIEPELLMELAKLNVALSI